jgi:hypothetical protein
MVDVRSGGGSSSEPNLVPPALHGFGVISSDRSQIGLLGVPLALIGALIGTLSGTSGTGHGGRVAGGAVIGFAVGLAVGLVAGVALIPVLRVFTTPRE